MSIQALEKTVKPGDYVIDVGCGSGVLSIASRLLGAEKVLALDLDDVAVQAANINVKLNKVQSNVVVKQNNLLDGIQDEANVIVANLLAEIILRFPDDAYKTLKQGGYFITSGIINQKRQEVEEGLKQSGFTIVETLVMEDWVTFISQKQK